MVRPAAAVQLSLPLAGDEGRGPRAPPLGAGGGVTFLDLPCRTALNRAESGRMEDTWTLNPYRGCEFGCAYCFARYTHGYLEGEHEDVFDRRIHVKRNIGVRLAAELRRIDARAKELAIGTATDPYQPAERRFRVTRSLLEALLPFRGLTVRLVTKSALVASDADLLAELARRHRVEVLLSIVSTEATLLRALEPRAPSPELRFRAGARLAAAGVPWGLLAAPLLPFLADRPDDLVALVARAKEAGAGWAGAGPLRLGSGAKRRFLARVADVAPAQVAAFRTAYRAGDRLDEAHRQVLRQRFDDALARVGLAHGGF
jgi:DNA repair photolyase